MRRLVIGWGALTACVLVLSAFDARAQDAELEAALEEIADRIGATDDVIEESDELPAFGSEAFARKFNRPDVRVQHVLAVWGRIRPNDNDSTPLVWDPRVMVAEGDGVRVRRELRFETGDRVHPQEVRNQLDISSRTGPRVDGVVLQIGIAPTGLRSDAAPFLSFESGPLSLKIPGPDLPTLNETHIVDEAGNGLMLVALPRPPFDSPCPNGSEHGVWAQTRENGGVFGGVLRAENGRRSGFVAGRFFDVPDENRSVFRGKAIDRDGRFRAIVRGYIGQSTFHGRWVARGGETHGVERGMISAHPAGRSGHFRGKWAQLCLEEEPTQ